MSLPKQLDAALIVFAFVIVALVSFIKLSDSSDGQRRLNQYLAEFSLSTPSRDAVKALREIGTNAVPELLRLLQRRDSPFKQKLIRWINKQKYAPARLSTEEDCVTRALVALEILESQAEPAVSILGGWLKPENHRDARSRELAIIALGRIGHVARDAVPSLINALKETNAPIRASVCHTLGRIAGQPAIIVPALISRIDDTDLNVRLNSMIALSRFGPAAKPAVPALKRVLQDPDYRVSRQAWIAITNIELDEEVMTDWSALVSIRNKIQLQNFRPSR